MATASNEEEEPMEVDITYPNPPSPPFIWKDYASDPKMFSGNFTLEHLAGKHRWNITEIQSDLIKHFFAQEVEVLQGKSTYVFQRKIQMYSSEGSEEVIKIVKYMEENLSQLWYVEMNDIVSKELRLSSSLFRELTDSNCLVFISHSPSKRICVFSGRLNILEKALKALCVAYNRQKMCLHGATFPSPAVSSETHSPAQKSTHDQGKMDFIIGSLRVKIYQRSILDVRMDAIVNAANEFLTFEAGISKTISEAAGYDYSRECDKLLKAEGPVLETSKCYQSRPGKLSDKFKVILHAVGPRWTDYEDKELCLQLLRQTIQNLLRKAESLYVTSLAMPAISSGHLGVPIELCAESYFLGIERFYRKDKPVFLKEVHLVDSNPEVIQELFVTSRKFMDDPFTISPTAVKSRYPQHFGDTIQNVARGTPQTNKTPLSSSQPLQFKAGSIKVKVFQESILKVKADAIVNAANENLSHGAGVALVISEAAGKKFDTECQSVLRSLNRNLNPTEVLETSPGNLKQNFKVILNAVGPRWNQYPDKTVCLLDLNQTIKNILEKAEKLRLSSVAMPAISSGIFGVPLKVCAETYVLGIHEFSKQKPIWLDEVLIVDIDPSVLTELKSAYHQYRDDPSSLSLSSAKSRHPALMTTLTTPSAREQTENTSRDGRRNRFSESRSVSMYPEPNTKTSSTDPSSTIRSRGASSQSHSKKLLRLPDGKIGQQLVKVFSFEDLMVVKIYTGSIVRFQGDAIICSNDDRMSGIGPLATAISTAGGPKYSESYSKIRKNYLYGISKGKPGDIETCSGGNLKVTFVVHAIINSLSSTDNRSLQSYGETLKNIFCTINKYRKSRKFAMPLIGAGQVEKSSEDLQKCCLTLFQVFADSCQDKQSNHAVKELHLINKNPIVTKSLVDVFTCNISKQADETVQTPSSHNRSRHSSNTMLGYEDKTPVNGHHGHLNRQQSWSQSHSGGITDDQNNVDFRRTGARPKTEMARSKSMYTKRPNTGTGRKDKKENIEDLIARSSMSMGSYDNSEVIGKTTSSGKNDGNLKIIGLDDDSESNDSGDVDRNEDLDVVDETTTCVICLDDIKNGIKLTCGHEFCKGCLTQSFSKHKQACPVCGKIFGEVTGNQPPGEMTVEKDRRPLPGYEGCGTITVKYKFNSGIQRRDHPNPGQPYDGTERRGFLPDNEEGRKVLRLLEQAFNRKLTFTIGYSRTTGKDNVVTWNDIHHKTKRDTGAQRFGYPDPTYLQRVQEELAAKGVTE